MAGNGKGRADLLKELRQLRKIRELHIRYIRSKTNQLLQVMGTKPLNPEELDDNTLLDLDPIGIVARSFGQVLDHLKETNSELTMARDQLKAIFDATGVGISIIDPDFRILMCNEKHSELLTNGKTGDVIGRFCHDVCCNQDSPRIGCPAVDTFATGKAVIQMSVEKKGKYFQVITTPLRDARSKLIGVIEVLLDVSEKTRAENAEKEQRGFYLAEKLKLEAVIRSLSDGLLVTDRTGAIISANDAVYKISGHEEKDVMGKQWEDFFDLLSAMKLNGNSGPTDFAAITPDKRQIQLQVIPAMVKDVHGRESGRVFTIRDITEEKKRQEMYYRTEKMVALGQVSAGVAHELNTPLGSILGYARLLLRDVNLDPLHKERLEIIAEQARRGSLIINGLLNFSRQSKPSLMNREKADLNQIIFGVFRIVRAEAKNRGITLVAELGHLSPIEVDKRRIEQVILNIVLNSIQAINRDGNICVRTDLSADEITIEIKDDGPGIPDTIRAKIFDPFFTTKPIGEGTGLGLSICAGIVHEHGGKIAVNGAEGGGAAFVITLPAERSTAP